MPLHPSLQPLVDAAAAMPASPDGLSVDELRAFAHGAMEQMFSRLSEAGPEMAAVEDHRVPVEGGAITVRIYRPEGDGPFPAHLYLHGGGFWLGSIDMFDATCRWVASLADCVVASVDYRLAPETKFPTLPEDCYGALLWLVDHAAELQVDTGRVSVGGASAGGDLAAVTALMARDRGGPPLVFQVLEIPVTDLTMSQPSIQENGEGLILTESAISQYIGYYLADPSDATNPYASPLLADDLSGLPPALVMTAEYDPLRDEGEAYGRRLQAAGVPTTIRRWAGQFHGSQHMAAIIPAEAKEYREMVAAALREAYER
ncbi:MAG: lipase/esterase [Acidimicrobiales bacterium]|jgi:acetyl esterase|nr:lipase/esterase [Acidimicrobiales bacterium]